MLTPKGAEELGALMRRLVARGLAIIFITHKLHEAFAYGDRVSILRNGRKVGEIEPERLRGRDEAAVTAEIVRLMFGSVPRANVGIVVADRAPERERNQSESRMILEVIDLSVHDMASRVGPISFKVASGEILGIAGIDGNGQKQLVEALSGQRPVNAGRILLDGAPIEGLEVGERRRRGLRYVTDDRLFEGTVASLPVATNFLLKQIGERPYWRSGFDQPGAIAAYARRLVQEFDVRTPSVETPIGRLSGGNIQKALLARELSGPAKVVIFAKPTYGLDVQNIVATRRRIREATEAGMAAILISTDLDELIELADRIAVLSGGRLVGTVDGAGADARRQIGELMIGLAA